MSAQADPSGAPNGESGGAASAPASPLSGAERFRFGVPARLEYRDAVRSFISHVCEQLAARGILSVRDAHGVVSAFVEAFNNAVIHAYEGHAAGPIEVAMSVDPRLLQVEVRDAGRTFVPDDVPEPDLDALPEGGLGLFIIRSFMDDIRYERRGLQNVLMMRKRLAPVRATAAAGSKEASRASTRELATTGEIGSKPHPNPADP